jgi:hypothetical protein
MLGMLMLAMMMIIMMFGHGVCNDDEDVIYDTLLHRNHWPQIYTFAHEH